MADRNSIIERLAFSFLIASTLVIPCASASENEKKEDSPLWSFAALEKKKLPAVKDASWPQNRIDHFILARMEAEGLQPAPSADERVLLRRLNFDLIGLPPTAKEVDEFCACTTDEKIDELLTSPHHGERWGRHWLDVARYSDTTASWLKSTASPWLYRDWVVNAFNNDMSYKQFVMRQLATDLMRETPPEDNAALGFLGLSPTYWKELQLPPELIKVTVADEWEERIDALGRSFLGLTLACARCHDHKSDPVSTKDYYALAGVFASIRITDRPTMDEKSWAPVAAAHKMVTGLEKKMVDLKKKKPKPADLDKQVASIQKAIVVLKKNTPHYNVPMVSGVEEAALFVTKKDKGHGTKLDYKMGKGRNLMVQQRGNPNTLGEEVPRSFLSAFPQKGGSEPRSLQNGSGRLELASAMVEDAEPLVARVIVNRVWSYHFGRGLVMTPSNFGKTGDAPSHPDLLDDLAARFVQDGKWSLKWLHREILNSATWQQSSIAPDAVEKDPENVFYARMNRLRLEVESWRDTMLKVSGTLDETIGGKAGNLTDNKNSRRTLYGKIHRRDLDQMLRVNDFPDPASHSPTRDETITPLQLLFTLNGPLLETQAANLAERIEKEAEKPDEQINFAYRLLFQRSPSEKEQKLGLSFLTSRENSLPLYAQALLGSNEFLYLD